MQICNSVSSHKTAILRKLSIQFVYLNVLNLMVIKQISLVRTIILDLYTINYLFMYNMPQNILKY